MLGKEFQFILFFCHVHAHTPIAEPETRFHLAKLRNLCFLFANPWIAVYYRAGNRIPRRQREKYRFLLHNAVNRPICKVHSFVVI